MKELSLQSQAQLGICQGASSSRDRPNFISNCIIILTSQGAAVLLMIVLEIVYARFLGPAGRGLLSLSLMAISFSSLVGGLGGEIPIILWTADRTQKRGEFLPAILFWGAVGSLAALVLWGVTFWVIHPVFLRGVTSRLAALVFAAIPPYIFFNYFAACLTGAERFGQLAKLWVGQKMLILGGIVILVLHRWMSAETALFTNLFGTVFSLTAALVFARRHIPADWNFFASRARLAPALGLGTRGQVGNVASFFNYRLDVFIVNSFLGPAQVGLYSLGVMISESLWQVPYAVALALLPRTARTLRETNAPFTCLVVRGVLALASVGGIFLGLGCQWFVPRIFGSRFQESVTVIWWILPGTVAFASARVMAADLAAREKVGYNSISAILALALTVVLDIILIPRMGINGAALASSTAYLFNTVLLSVKLKRTLCVTWKSLLVPSTADVYFRWPAQLAMKKLRRLQSHTEGTL